MINCEDEGCVKERALESQALLGSSCWIHLDVADGGFTDGYTTWRDPAHLRTLIPKEIRVELHLMVHEAELNLLPWLSAGIQRVIVHRDTIGSTEAIMKLCEPYGVSVILGISPQEATKGIQQEDGAYDGFHVLAVNPGRSGQAFITQSLAIITELAKRFPGKQIGVDGGVNLEVATQCAKAGATRCAVSTALWGATDRKATVTQFLQIH